MAMPAHTKPTAVSGGVSVAGDSDPPSWRAVHPKQPNRPVRFRCGSCSKPLTSIEARSGRLVRCPVCGQTQRVPHHSYAHLAAAWDQSQSLDHQPEPETSDI